VDLTAPRWHHGRVPHPRAWLTLLAFVLALGALADRADAQAFKPRSRNGIAAKRGPTTPAAATAKTPARTAVTTPAPAPRKAPAAATAPAKPPAAKKPPKKKAGGDDDDDDEVVVTDGDD
jgi:hypothetical protein